MRFYDKGIKDSNNFTTNGKIKSLLLGLKDIDMIDTIVINLSMMSMIFGYSYGISSYSVNNVLSRTSRTSLNINKFLSYKKW